MLRTAFILILTLAVSLPAECRAQQVFLRFPGLMANDIPLLNATVRQLRQQGIRTFMVYEPHLSYADTSAASTTYLLWTDGRAVWAQLIRPHAVYRPLRLPAANPFTYLRLSACGVVKQEDQLRFKPPVVGGGNGLLAYASPSTTFYFEAGEMPAGYVPQPHRQEARQRLVALLDKQLATLAPQQQVLRTYQREAEPTAGLFTK